MSLLDIKKCNEHLMPFTEHFLIRLFFGNIMPSCDLWVVWLFLWSLSMYMLALQGVIELV